MSAEPRPSAAAAHSAWMVGASAGAIDPDPERLWTLAPPRFLRRVPGRESFEHELDGVRVIVKRFRGGEPRDWWSERARGLALRSPARAEAENLLALRALGCAVPEPLWWAEERSARVNPWRGRGRSLLVQRYVPHERTLADRGAAAFAPALGAFVGKLHARGWCHRDLYLEHFLVAQNALVLIDLGRARHARELARRWIVKDLAALAMSCPPEAPRRARLAALASWRRAQPDARRLRGAALRALVASIERKARRLAAHAPKYAYDRAAQRPLGWSEPS
ncbi:MAG: hypothetical protein EPO68_09105 [Planctomycetota bacterium]|nr:MAG: hypothetical protein EPO68_09105 [Planctomycetota bacterium]